MLTYLIRRSCALGALFLLAACGGGSGGEDDAGSGLPNAALNVLPRQLTITTFQGTAAQAVLNGTLGSQVNGPVYIAVIDRNNTFTTDFQLEFTSDTSASLTLNTRVSLPQGIRNGLLEIHACKNLSCTSEYTGSPVSVPYSVNVQPIPPAAQATPSALTLGAYINEATALEFDVELSEPASGANYFRLSDEAGLISGLLEWKSTDVRSYRLRTNLIFANTGTYSGTARLQVCYESTCSNEAPGSPIALPYTLVVAPSGTLSTLPAPIGLPDWETYQANAAHNAYVPVTLNPTSFSRRWMWTTPVSWRSLNAPVVVGGKLLVSTRAYSQPGHLYALNEADGSLAWQYNFGEVPNLNPPAAAAGRVFIATSGQEKTFLFNLNLANGVVNSQTAFSAQGASYLSPTVEGGVVFSNGGYYGGLYTWNAGNGEQQWFTSLPQEDGWTPAVDSRYAYAYMRNQLYLLDRNSGGFFSSTASSEYDTRRGIVPVLTGSNSVAVVNGAALMRFARSGSSLSESWHQKGWYTAEPVVRGTTLYVANNSPFRLEARNEATGTLLWHWTPDQGADTLFPYNLIITDNLAFISTSSQTYAIDLSTHQTVWTFPYGGQLALSANRILYVQTGQDKIYAINVF